MKDRLLSAYRLHLNCQSKEDRGGGGGVNMMPFRKIKCHYCRLSTEQHV